VEWLIDLPTFVQVLTSFPNRLVRYAWLRPWPFGRAPAVHAQRYLARRPRGAHARELASWLEDWHGDRGNWLAAYEVAAGPGGDPDDLPELRQRAAVQALAGARKQTRPDLRFSMLRHVAREFQGTEAGEDAAQLARRELEEASSQRIRISRGFLEENPEVAGPDGLALRPELLDGEMGNGDSGRKSAAPAIRRQGVSEERLARVVALLHETAQENYLEDPGDVLGADADRDLFFERARLGVADSPDRRPAAQSTYAFVGLRERYGLVRGRESILPFDIVIQGSLPDLGLGVFPRMRVPRPTPDAVLYK
jgi:hypothetical protein